MGLLLSIEFDNRNIRIIEASKKRDTLTILNCLTIISPVSITESKIDDLDSIACAIKKEIIKHNIKAKKAIFSINSTSIITRKIRLPILKKNSEILSMLKYELEQLISIDMNQYHIIYKPVETSEKNNVKFALYVVYCLPIYIYNQFDLLSKKLKLKLICVDSSFNCLNKLFTHNIEINNKELNQEEIYAFVNIDLFSCCFCVLNKGINDFSRISAINEFYNAEFAAEQQANYGSSKLLNPTDYMNIYLEEISKSIRYYYSVDNAKNIKELYIYGACSNMNDLCEYLSSNLSIDIEKIHNISKLKLQKSVSVDNPFVNNYFNSILSLYNDANDIYFCKESFNNKYGMKRYVSVIISVVVVFLGNYTLNYSNDLLNNKINNMSLYINDKHNIELNNQIENIINENMYMENYLKDVENLIWIINKSDCVSSNMLKEIYKAIPLNTKVTSIFIDKNNTQLHCVSLSMEEVTFFIQNLRKIEFVDTIHVPDVELDNNNLNYSYSVICKLKDVNKYD